MSDRNLDTGVILSVWEGLDGPKPPWLERVGRWGGGDVK